jgi:histidine triad (HIT) family protein
MNNLVSQSVPHLHVHVVPGQGGDGPRGFLWPRTTYLWPRTTYAGEAAMAEVAALSRGARG